MADNNINIGGMTYSIPSWASETTLQEVKSTMAQNIALERALIKLLGDAGKDIEKVKKETENLNKTQQNNRKKIEQSQQATGRKVGRAFNGLINRFNQTERPLSAMVDLFGDMGTGFGAITDKLGKMDNKAGGIFKKIGEFSKYAGPVIEMGMAYAGFYAAKIEQFAEAQKAMIDAGAIFREGGIAGFQDLRSRTYDAGISYQALSKIVGGYGVAIQNLSNGVSGGTDKFVDYFTAMNDAADNFGDFGLSSEEMASAYAEYINVQRLTGNVNRNTLNVQEKLNNGFTQLMLETSSLAALTGENRSEQLKKQMAALSDIDISGGLIILRKQGMEGQAKVVEEFTKQMASMSDHTGELGQQIVSAFNTEFAATARDIGQFDIRKQMDPALVGAMEKATPGLLDEINRRVKTGEIENVANFARDKLLKVTQEQYGTSLATKDGQVGMVQEFQKISIALRQTQGNLEDQTDEERIAAKKAAAAGLKGTGEITKNMNTLTEGYLKAQDALTPSLEFGSDAMQAFGKTLQAGADWLQGLNKSAKQSPEAFMDTEFGEMSRDLSTPPKRATGGPVAGGMPYTVGERGTEMFIPETSGSIMPADHLSGLFDAITKSRDEVAKDMLMSGGKVSMKDPELMDKLAAQGQWDRIYASIPDQMKGYFDYSDGLSGKNGEDVSWTPEKGWVLSISDSNGETITTDASGVAYSGGYGIKKYDHNGKLLFTQSPTMQGMTTREYADGGKSVEYAVGTIRTKKSWDAAGKQIEEFLQISMGPVMASLDKITGDESISYNVGGLKTSASYNKKTGVGSTTQSLSLLADGTESYGDISKTSKFSLPKGMNFAQDVSGIVNDGYSAELDALELDEENFDKIYNERVERFKSGQKDAFTHDQGMEYYKRKDDALTSDQINANMLMELEKLISNAKNSQLIKRAQENLDV